MIDTKWRDIVRGILPVYDLPSHFRQHIPHRFTQALIALACASLAILTREAIDLVAPGAGPFALNMPFVLFATLFARWESGIATLAMLVAFSWYYVLPAHQSFDFEVAGDAPRVFVNALSGVLIVALGEYFRRLVQSTLEKYDSIAEERLLLLNELDHRVKNNFAMVSAIVRMEIRDAGSEELTRVLKKIGGRMESIARAHEALYRGEDGVGEVHMGTYLHSLCRSLESGLFRSLNVHLRVDVDDVALERDIAISVGLIVNELCTNAAKHAFQGRSSGEVLIQLKTERDGVRIVVADDGIGLTNAVTSGTRSGSKLVRAFATQAGGELVVVPTETGTRFEIVLARDSSRRARLV